MTYAFTAEGQAQHPSKSYIRNLQEMFPGQRWLLGILALGTLWGFWKGGGDNLRDVAPTDAEDTEYYRQFLKYPLTQICRERGLSVQGTREDLIHRLQQYDAGK